MPMLILQATLPDGSIVTRKTDRDYQWLVCVAWMREPDKWQARRWSGSAKLADAAMREEARMSAVANVQIVRVVPATLATLAGIRADKRARVRANRRTTL